MILDIFYAIFIQPIEWGMSWAFAKFYGLASSYGLAILLLSLIVNFSLIPIYLLSDRWMEEERSMKEKMAAKLREIKTVFAGHERFMMIRMLYKINNYHPLMAARNSVGLLIQILFFFAAYQLLSGYDALLNVSFLIFNDLSEPDGLLSIGSSHINLMPFVMTGINLASAYIYASSLSKKAKIKAYLIAGIFLIILYSMPVALVLYWTMNNLFSLVKNLIYKKFAIITPGKVVNTKGSSKYIGLFKETFLIFVAMFIAFIVVPLFMIGNSPEDFYFIDAKVFVNTAILFTILSGLITSFINLIFRFFRLTKVSVFYIYFGFSYIVLSGFLFPVSVSAVMIDPESNPVNYFNLLLVVTTSILIASACLNRFREHAQLFLAIIVLISTGSALLSISKHEILSLIGVADKPIISQKQSSQFSSNKNIFVISFDGLSGDIVNDLIKNRLEFSHSLKDFIIFENSVNHAPSTTDSLGGDIYGVQDYRSLGDSSRSLKKNLLKSELFENIAANKIVDSYQHGYHSYRIKPVDLSVTSSSETFNFFRYPMVRIGTSYGLNILNWRRFKRFEKYVGVKQQVGLTVLLDEIQKDGRPQWANYLRDFYNYDSFLSSASIGDKPISLRYLHFLFTHSPVRYDEKCTYKGNDKDWFNSNQNKQGLLKQTTCGLEKFSMFLERLKQLGIYNESLIVFKSDHGANASYYSEYPDNLYINDNLSWGYSRYKSFLMIKDFGSVNENPVFKSDLVLQNDIAKTVCLNSGVAAECDVFNGVNLLAETLKTDEPYYLYVPKNQDDGYWLFENLISVKIPSRSVSLLQAMQNSELIKLSAPAESKK
jgi:membrane protein insertase Oxa1/YidC/SpoIIIJ